MHCITNYGMAAAVLAPMLSFLAPVGALHIGNHEVHTLASFGFDQPVQQPIGFRAFKLPTGKLCQSGVVYSGDIGHEACFARCLQERECFYASVWTDMNRCRLTKKCLTGFPSMKNITIWEKDLTSVSLPVKSKLRVQRRDVAEQAIDQNEDVPKAPGCYLRTLTGCRRHPLYNASSWKHDVWGETYTSALFDRELCEVDRKAHLAQWCGATDVEVKFVRGASANEVPTNPPNPTMPGCFVWTPTGCPKHPRFQAPGWRHEIYGENLENAKKDRTVCEVARKEFIARWCGAEDVRMKFVGPKEAQLKSEVFMPGPYVEGALVTDDNEADLEAEMLALNPVVQF